MTATRADFLAIAILLFDGPDLGHHPWRGIHSGYNCYFDRKDHWEIVKIYYERHVEGFTLWPLIISTAWHNGKRVSDSNAAIIQDVMKEFDDREVRFGEIWA